MIDKVKELGLLYYDIKEMDFNEENIIEHPYGTYFIDPYEVCSSVYSIRESHDVNDLKRNAYRVTQRLIHLNKNEDIDSVIYKAKEYILYVVQANKDVLSDKFFNRNGYFNQSNTIQSSIIAAGNDYLEGIIISELYEKKKILLKDKELSFEERGRRMNIILGYATKKMRKDDIEHSIDTIIEIGEEMISSDSIKRYITKPISDRTIYRYLISFKEDIEKYNMDRFGYGNINEKNKGEALNKIASGAMAIHNRDEYITKIKIHKETEVSRPTIDKHYPIIKEDIEEMNSRLK